MVAPIRGSGACQTVPVSRGTDHRARLQAAHLYFVADRAGLERALDGALAGGADLVQLRDKTASDDEIVAADAIVGLSTHSIAQADAGARSGADYIAVGPVHETPTKEGRPAIGLEPIRHAAAHVAEVPWFAIGGIDERTVGDVVRAGARRAVIVRAI